MSAARSVAPTTLPSDGGPTQTMALLAGTANSLPNQRDFRLIAAHLPEAARHRALMEGIDLPPGGLARRALADVGEMPPELVKALHQRDMLKSLSETPAGPLNDPNRLLAQVGPMLAQMPDDMAASTAYAVAQRYVRMGQWSMAREIFLLLVDRYPAHPLAMDSYHWLIRHNSSTEARHRHELGQFVVVESEQRHPQRRIDHFSLHAVDVLILNRSAGSHPLGRAAS